MTDEHLSSPGRAESRAQRQTQRQRSARTTTEDAVVVRSGLPLLLGVLALVGEVLLFAGLGQLLHWLAGGGWLGVVIAAVGLLVGAGAWAFFMAPTAARRLPTLVRSGLCAASGLVLGGALALVGWPRFGVAVVLGGAAAALTQHVLGGRGSAPSERTTR